MDGTFQHVLWEGLQNTTQKEQAAKEQYRRIKIEAARERAKKTVLDPMCRKEIELRPGY